MRIPTWAARFEYNLAALLLGVLLIAMCWQVLTRYVLGVPSDWTEEASRYLYVYVVFLGTSAGISARSHVSISYFTDRLSPLPRLIVSLGVDVLILAFLAVMVWWGTRATLRNSTSRSRDAGVVRVGLRRDSADVARDDRSHARADARRHRALPYVSRGA
jgi:TRAP-type C4-dicarboxylate transport system permease small subunit